ncbi:tetracycline resistance MFS efflux pump, partial [Mucilaginibacter sp. 5B2]|nr:tetracycline resistance MFS efflux pump [Mucilaginibacter sp. 5B2]
LQGVMTNEVPKNEQGELQGGLTSLMSLSSIFGPWFMTFVFYYFTKPGAPVHLPGAPYFIASVLMLIGAVLAVRSFRKEKQSAETSAYNTGSH